jgi:hypothetical protein
MKRMYVLCKQDVEYLNVTVNDACRNACSLAYKLPVTFIFFFKKSSKLGSGGGFNS